MATGKANEEAKLKRHTSFNNSRDKKEMQKQELVKKVLDETKGQLLPTIQTKMVEVVDYVVSELKESENDLNVNQVMSLLAKKSLSELAMSSSQISYTAQEIAIAFNIYLDMINKINKITKFPPTIHSFTTMLGVTAETFNNWLANPDKREIANYIRSYFIGTINTATLIKQVETIAGIYTTKTMGLIEQAQPIVIEHKKTTDIDEINAQLSALKGDGIIEATYEEIEK